ncbi:hypothetical protein ACHFCA_27345 [Delftia tsuruhatensis]
MTLEMGKHDQERLAQIQANRERIEGPRIGDFVVFSTGQIERFSHAWDDCLQTSPAGHSFCMPLEAASFQGLSTLTRPGNRWS